MAEQQNTRFMPLFRCMPDSILTAAWQTEDPTGGSAGHTYGRVAMPIPGSVDQFGNQYVRLVASSGGGVIIAPYSTVDGASDAYVDPFTALATGAFAYGFNGTNWDRLRSGGNNTSTIAVSTLGNLSVRNFNYAFDTTNWTRLLSLADNADAAAVVTTGPLRSVAELFGFNGATWDRLRSTGDNADALATITLGVQRVAAENYGFNGTTWDRVRSGGNNAQTIATTTLGNLRVTNFSFWWDGTTWARSPNGSISNRSNSIMPVMACKPRVFGSVSFPGRNVQASVVQGANPNVAWIAQSLTAVFSCDVGSAPVATLNLRIWDGVSGVGGLIFQTTYATGGMGDGDILQINLADLNLDGTKGNVMTAEFDGAGGVNTQQSVSLGVTVST